MKNPQAIVVFILFVVLSVFSFPRIKTNFVANEENIAHDFFTINPEQFHLEKYEYEQGYAYASNQDIRKLQYTQNIETMLNALEVSAKDIKKIANLLDIKNTIVKQGDYIKMLYHEDVDSAPQAEIMPPYIPEGGFVRGIEYLSFPVGKTRYILTKKQGKFTLQKRNISTKRQAVYAQGKIKGSLYDAFITQEIPHNVFQTFVNIYQYDVDFQRDIRNGDAFEIVYDTIVNDENIQESLGRVLYVKLKMKTKRKLLEYFILKRTGRREYYDRKGNAASKTFIKTPINGARISSRYGWRKHPILGYSRLHTGVDFAAPTGTAIYAAADGIITFMGWNGSRTKGYGRYTVIKHNKNYSTAYAHQSGFNRRLRRGVRVRQGQVIGYVGSTGYSTGAHLHYEVIYKGKKINPSKVTSLTKVKLSGKKKATLFANIKMVEGIIEEAKKEQEKD